MGPDQILLVETQIVLNGITKLGNTVKCVCEPAHVGVQGNEEAKRAINRKNLDVEVRHGGAESKSLMQKERGKKGRLNFF